MDVPKHNTSNVHSKSSSSSSIASTSALSIHLRQDITETVDDKASANGLQMADSSELRIMIVGDSMTHANEGDYTWRYRLWEWIRVAAPTGRKITFVGPHTGTSPPQRAHPPLPPRLPGEAAPEEPDIFSGGYAHDVPSSFPRAHFSQSGRQMAQARDDIAEAVAKYAPDVLLIMLGFNDLAWGVSNPEGLLGSTSSFVHRARSAAPAMQICLGNVPQRSPMPNFPDLGIWTARYNALLYHALLAWAGAGAKLVPVELERAYGFAAPDAGAGTFDDVHPNERGEYQIAAAFSRALHTRLGWGDAPLRIPDEIPAQVLPVPSHPRALPVPYGIRFEFGAVYGARGYDIRQRIAAAEDESNGAHPDGDDAGWSESMSATNAVDNVFTPAGLAWEYQARATRGPRKEDKSDWTPVVCGIARRDTAPAPSDGKVYAVGDGFEVTWTPLDEHKWHVDRYAVLWKDQKGGFLCGQAARGSRTVVSGCEQGHRYDVWVQTWDGNGPGVMEGLGMVVVGSGVFAKPEGKRNDGREEGERESVVKSPEPL